MKTRERKEVRPPFSFEKYKFNIFNYFRIRVLILTYLINS